MKNIKQITKEAKNLKTGAKIFFYNSTLGERGDFPYIYKTENIIEDNEFEDMEYVFKEFMKLGTAKGDADYYYWNESVEFMNSKSINWFVNMLLTVENMEKVVKTTSNGLEYLNLLINDCLEYL